MMKQQHRAMVTMNRFKEKENANKKASASSSSYRSGSNDLRASLSTSIHNNNGGRVEQDGLLYNVGFGNAFQSECLPGALPVGRNTPRHVPYNLYTEQLSGTAFTAPRATNQRTWIYRVQPPVVTGAAEPVLSGGAQGGRGEKQVYFGHVNPADCLPEINPLRWQPRTVTQVAEMTVPWKDYDDVNAAATDSSEKKIDFLRGIYLQCTSDASHDSTKCGLSIYQYCFNADMVDRSLVNADGEVCILPQHGSLFIRTELGCMVVHPKELAVIPSGLVHSVQVWNGEEEATAAAAAAEDPDRDQAFATSGGDDDDDDDADFCRGYVIEIYSKGGGFTLPTLGPIGANGLANARDFQVPVAAVSAASQREYQREHVIYTKSHGGLLWKRTQPYTPYNVVAWHGNYAPYKYRLERFCAVNSVSYDHLDPSIYTVLTCQSEVEGTALADVVIFPPRWQATDAETFRPPYFHRNCMSEYMGLICGRYDAKEAGKDGFVPGGSSLHPIMTPHGPDTATFEEATADPCDAPKHFEGGLAFMFETALPLAVAPDALRDPTWRDVDYAKCWQGLSAKKFTGWDMLLETRRQQQQQQEESPFEVLEQNCQ